MNMLDAIDVHYDIVHTLSGVMYNSNKEEYKIDKSVQNFVCGSYQLAKAVDKVQPSAYFLLDDFSFKDWYKIFGAENMLKLSHGSSS